MLYAGGHQNLVIFSLKNRRGFGQLANYADRAPPLVGEVLPTFWG
jgi:hypothetical protein